MNVRLAAAAAVVLTAVTAPSAMGATILSSKACFREGEAAGFVGIGFQPGQEIAVSLDGRQFATDMADPAGKLAGAVSPLPPIARSETTRALSMTQTSNPALTATKTFKETKLYVVTKPGSFRPGRKLRIRAGGFYEAGPTLYGHVRGPKQRNLRIGRVTGPCGKVSATKKVILKKRDKPGFYIVQFDTMSKYHGTKVGLQVRKAYTIRRIFRFSRTSPFAAPVFGSAPRWVPEA